MKCCSFQQSNNLEPIAKLAEEWNKLHPMHPNKPIGNGILQFLMRPDHLSKYEKPKSTNFRFPPTEAELFEDVQEHRRFFNHLAGEMDTDYTWIHFIKGWGAMRSHGDPTMDNHTPLVAFDVVSKPGRGVSRSVKVLEELQEEDVFIDTDEGRNPLLTSVMTPAGTITSPHCDNTGRGHVLLGTYGVKLTMWWDTTQELFENYGAVHCKKKGDLTLGALEMWPGLHWTILYPGDYIFLTPGQVHAVLSPVNSAVSGWTYVKAEWIENGLLEERMMWEIGVVKSRIEADEKENLYEEAGPISALRGDINLLNQWLESLAHGSLKKKVKTLMRKIQQKLDELNHE